MITPQLNCPRLFAEVLGVAPQGGARQGKELAGLALGDHLQPRLQDKPARADVSAQPLSQLSLKAHPSLVYVNNGTLTLRGSRQPR
jgi:hypothetical protein